MSKNTPISSLPFPSLCSCTHVLQCPGVVRADPVEQGGVVADGPAAERAAQLCQHRDARQQLQVRLERRHQLVVGRPLRQVLLELAGERRSRVLQLL